MAAAFKKGDVGRVKSGGPRMNDSHTGIYAEGMGTGPAEGVVCVWFEVVKGSQPPQEKVFDAAVLELA